MKRKIKIKKRLLLFFIAIAVGVANSFAQDVITLKDGKEIIALVYEIGDIDVKYKKIDNPDGPNYVLKKSEIVKVKYANGSEDIFSEIEQTAQNTLTSLNVYIPNGSKYSDDIDYIDFGTEHDGFSNKVSYNGGNFTLNLKDILPDSEYFLKRLLPDDEEYIKAFSRNTGKDITEIYSDPNLRMMGWNDYMDNALFIRAFKNGKFVGFISKKYSGNSDEIDYKIMRLVYADRICQIAYANSSTGSGTMSDANGNMFTTNSIHSTNLSLKKGWNIIYSGQTNTKNTVDWTYTTVTFVTTIPQSGLEWIVDVDSNTRTFNVSDFVINGNAVLESINGRSYIGNINMENGFEFNVNSRNSCHGVTFRILYRSYNEYYGKLNLNNAIAQIIDFPSTNGKWETKEVIGQLWEGETVMKFNGEYGNAPDIAEITIIRGH